MRDYPNAPWTLDVPLTEDIESIVDGLRKIEVDGGGDISEPYLRAFFEVSRLGWRPSSRRAFVIFGEGYQNNHHAYPRSARFSYKRPEIDIGYAMCRLLEKVGCLEIERAHLIPAVESASGVGLPYLEPTSQGSGAPANAS